MALLHLMMQAFPKTEIDAVTFDHGLRINSAAEAKKVGRFVAGWPRVTHHILTWSGKKPQSAIMEAAREARYRALTKFCTGHGVDQIWLGHHAGDQAETFFFRLAKGSGLDGLGGMAEVSQGNVALMRPLLGFSKEEILAYCKAQDIPFVRDPSNTNKNFARPRLRSILPHLAEEGMTEARLTRTMARLRRAREALDFYALRLMEDAVQVTKEQAVLDYESFAAAPEEIRLRALRHVIAGFGKGEKGGTYGPRLDRLEDLWAQMWCEEKPLKGFTIAGLKITRRDKLRRIVVECEK
jgi:tRNA(Ile)-lysidine synthase